MADLTKPQLRALIDAWPTAKGANGRDVRILHDSDCPQCHFPELGRTIGSAPLPDLSYCRRCACSLTALPRGDRREARALVGALADRSEPALVALAVLAVRAWNPDLPLHERQTNRATAVQAAAVALRCGLGAALVRMCGAIGPRGSMAAARRLLADAQAEARR